MDYKAMLFQVLRERPKEVSKLEISKNRGALLELLPHAPACYLHLNKSLRAEKEILLAALNDAHALEGDKPEAEQENNVLALASSLRQRKPRSDDWYDYHAYSKQWQSKVPAALKKDLDFMTTALEINAFTTQLIDHEISQEPQFLVRLAELHGIGVFALNLDGELLKRATAGNRPGDLNVEDSVAQRIYEELKSNIEQMRFNEQTSKGKPTIKPKFKV